MKRIILATAAAVAVALALGVSVEAQTLITRTATWTDNSTDEDGFRVYRMSGKLAEAVQVCQVAANIKTCTFSEPAGSVGCYIAVAYNSVGESATSNAACINFAAPATTLAVK